VPREPLEAISGNQFPTPETAIAPSPCQLRLAELAVFEPSPPITGPGKCAATDVVKVNAVLLPDKHRVAFSPPVILRCPMAEAVAQWITSDVAPTIAALGTPLRSIESLDSFDCRPRNGMAGAPLSEHGHANALDVRSLKLANGEVIELNNASVAKSLRERLRDSACARFSTVLGNGADAYHSNHVHLDLMARSNNYKICQWDVLDPAETAALAAKKAAAAAAHIPLRIREASAVPLPRPRPEVNADAVTVPWDGAPRKASAAGPDEIGTAKGNQTPPQPVSTATICSALAAAAAQNDLPADFLARLIWRESRFDPAAVSPAGAQGVAQFMPATANWRGLSNPFDPLDAIAQSARLLRDLRREFGNLGLAVAAYNAGSGRVRDWLAGRRALPAETAAYVRVVTGYSPEQWAGAPAGIGEMKSEPPVPCREIAGPAARITPHAGKPKTAALVAKKAPAAAAHIPARMGEVSTIPLPRRRPQANTDVVILPLHSAPRVSLAAFAMTYAEQQAVTVGPWTIAVSYKGDRFESCSMNRSTTELGITFIRVPDGLLLVLDSQKWKLERGKAYAVRLVAGSRSVEAKALAEFKAVTVALVDRSLNESLRTADVLEAPA
jgi:hypothetical protein